MWGWQGGCLAKSLREVGEKPEGWWWEVGRLGARQKPWSLEGWRLKAEDSWLELKPGPHFLCHPISHWLGNGGYFGFIYNDMWSYYIMQWNTNSQHHRSVPSGALDSVWWFLVWDFEKVLILTTIRDAPLLECLDPLFELLEGCIRHLKVLWLDVFVSKYCS